MNSMVIFHSYVSLPESTMYWNIYSLNIRNNDAYYHYLTILMHSWLDHIGYMFTHTKAFHAVLLAILKRSKRGSKHASQANRKWIATGIATGIAIFRFSQAGSSHFRWIFHQFHPCHPQKIGFFAPEIPPGIGDQIHSFRGGSPLTKVVSKKDSGVMGVQWGVKKKKVAQNLMVYHYPLVNVYITNWKDPPCYSWENPLFQWSFSIANCWHNQAGYVSSKLQFRWMPPYPNHGKKHKLKLIWWIKTKKSEKQKFTFGI